MVIFQKKLNFPFVSNSIQLCSNLYFEVGRKTMNTEPIIYVHTNLISTMKENCRLLLENIIGGNLHMHGDNLREEYLS